MAIREACGYLKHRKLSFARESKARCSAWPQVECMVIFPEYDIFWARVRDSVFLMCPKRACCTAKVAGYFFVPVKNANILDIQQNLDIPDG